MVAMVPSTTTTLTDPDQLVQMGKLLDALDDDDDVQNAWQPGERGKTSTAKTTPKMIA